MIRIKEIRKNKKITAKELADNINVAESTMSLYENGKREPDFATLTKIAKYLEVSVDYLIGYIEKENFSPAMNNSVNSSEPLTNQEEQLLHMFRMTTEEGRMRIISTVVSICDQMEEKRIAASIEKNA